MTEVGVGKIPRYLGHGRRASSLDPSEALSRGSAGDQEAREPRRLAGPQSTRGPLGRVPTQGRLVSRRRRRQLVTPRGSSSLEQPRRSDRAGRSNLGLKRRSTSSARAGVAAASNACLVKRHRRHHRRGLCLTHRRGEGDDEFWPAGRPDAEDAHESRSDLQCLMIRRLARPRGSGAPPLPIPRPTIGLNAKPKRQSFIAEGSPKPLERSTPAPPGQSLAGILPPPTGHSISRSWRSRWAAQVERADLPLGTTGWAL
mmetsp:Transcript_10374/g.27305  ORF Transcript_10374/g.27305 Transcript_10374/m.27305 type:complete len:257 (-) Transcript_10374:48-818(-)